METKKKQGETVNKNRTDLPLHRIEFLDGPMRLYYKAVRGTPRKDIPISVIAPGFEGEVLYYFHAQLGTTLYFKMVKKAEEK